MTWIDFEGRTWRVERIGNRWQLALYWPGSEQWQRVGSYPTRMDAVQAARDSDER